jgi:hypothetical protein
MACGNFAKQAAVGVRRMAERLNEVRIPSLSSTLVERDKSLKEQTSLQVPRKSYEPPQRDRNFSQAQTDHVRKDAWPPKVTFYEDDHRWRWKPDHPDISTGLRLLTEAIRAKDEAFGIGLLNQMASLAGRDGYMMTCMGDWMPDSMGEPMADTMNFMVSMVKGIEPKDTLEAALAVQMAAVHVATMRQASRLSSYLNPDSYSVAERALNRLARTFAAQVETLKKYRTGGEQKVTVQHVSVSDNAQAIVGNVSTGGGCNKQKSAGGRD